MAISEEKIKLFKKVKTRFGAPIRKVELTDDMMCDLLEQAVSDVQERILNYVIENNWSNLYGKQLSNLDLAWSLSSRTLDMSRDYSYYFSKEAGLQQRGPWELKKDFFEIEKGKQCYIIPAGREINRVLYVTPPTIDSALYASGGMGASFGAGVMGQLGFGAIGAFNSLGGYTGMGGLFGIQLSDIAYMSNTLKDRQQMFSGVLAYKVTAGIDGTHIIHLINGGDRFPTMTWSNQLVGKYCWYTYYDVTPDNVDECRKDNPDIVVSPDQIDISEIPYELLNDATKTTVRQVLIGLCAKTLATIRGMFSGKISMVQNDLTMDYNLLMNMGEKEYDSAMDALKERLERMSPYEMIKRDAEMVENIIKVRKGTPLKPTLK